MMPLWLIVICLTLAMALLDLALTGRTYTHGKSGLAPLATTKSVPLRLVFFLIGAGLIFWMVRQFIRTLHT